MRVISIVLLTVKIDRYVIEFHATKSLRGWNNSFIHDHGHQWRDMDSWNPCQIPGSRPKYRDRHSRSSEEIYVRCAIQPVEFTSTKTPDAKIMQRTIGRVARCGSVNYGATRMEVAA
ncbi:hypothetical protein ANTPLA_LOCUS2376 [Anthophora plagiata]